MEKDVKKKIIMIIIVVILIGLCIAGGTYAWLTQGLNVTNGNYSTNIHCFRVDYDVSNVEDNMGANLISSYGEYNNVTKSGDSFLVDYTTSTANTYIQFNLSTPITKNNNYVLRFDVTGLDNNTVVFRFPNSDSADNEIELVNGENTLYFSTWTGNDNLSLVTFDDYTNDPTATFTLSSFMLYEQSQDITGTLFPGSGPVKGLSGKVGLKINDDCYLTGTGKLKLHIDSNTSTKLTTVGAAHCENPTTLETLNEYKTSDSCSDNDGTWTETSTVLKYAVYDNDTATGTLLGAGYISDSNIGNDLVIADNIAITKTQAYYYVFIWLDGYLTDNTYTDLSFGGYVSAEATQNE